MVFETTSALSSSQIPQAESLIPGARKSVISVRWEDNITDEVRVSIQAFLGDSVVVGLTQQTPNNQSFV